ncbi:hypothetical protein [Chelatococcus sp.]|uniref:hypothetical protein n=1 Tax=Chelatococcus sp. TaxID=1953771 RepID=UPI0034401316
MIYGTTIWIAEKLKSEDGGYARGVWTSTRFFYPTKVYPPMTPHDLAGFSSGETEDAA